jgi:S-adenosylmethionine decarboxylase proenzyme
MLLKSLLHYLGLLKSSDWNDMETNTLKHSSNTDVCPTDEPVQAAGQLTGHDYQFEGQHLLVSYSACQIERLTDVEAVLEAFRRATLAAGATILSESHHVFLPHGLTAMLLLSESHASIHTYPEHASCFVDLFTCGEHCDASAFQRVLQDYFQPGEVQATTILRSTQFKQL